jgi:hypothetical protein
VALGLRCVRAGLPIEPIGLAADCAPVSGGAGEAVRASLSRHGAEHAPLKQTGLPDEHFAPSRPLRIAVGVQSPTDAPIQFFKTFAVAGATETPQAFRRAKARTPFEIPDVRKRGDDPRTVKKRKTAMLKYLLMAGVASALMAVAPPAFAKAKPLGCDRSSVDLRVVVTTYSGCKLAWWGAHFAPGDNYGGGGDNTTVVEISDPCIKVRCPPPPCYDPCKTVKSLSFGRRRG